MGAGGFRLKPFVSPYKPVAYVSKHFFAEACVERDCVLLRFWSPLAGEPLPAGLSEKLLGNVADPKKLHMTLESIDGVSRTPDGPSERSIFVSVNHEAPTMLLASLIVELVDQAFAK